MKPENIHTAQLFRATRTRLCLSVRSLAGKLKLAPSTLNRIESGHIAPNAPTTDKLMVLAEAENLQALFKEAYR
ncbi:MAG: helix-turn-helix transcriptional regulator [Salibacteraceae bacterium]